MTQVFEKDADAVLDYTIDWQDYLVTDDTISESDWVVPAGLTEDSCSQTSTTTTIWLSGGTEGETYEVTNRIVTAGARTDDRTFVVVVQKR